MIIYKNFCRKSVELQGFFCWLWSEPVELGFGEIHIPFGDLLEWDKKDYVL